MSDTSPDNPPQPDEPSPPAAEAAAPAKKAPARKRTPAKAAKAAAGTADAEPSPDAAATDGAPSENPAAGVPQTVDAPAADAGTWVAPDAATPAAEPAAATEAPAATPAAATVAPAATAAAAVATAAVPPQTYPADMARFSPLPPPPPGFLQTRWQGPDYAGGPAAWVAALIGGLATAIALPLSRPGIGWLLVGLVMTGAVWHAARFGPKPDTRTERWVRIGWAVLAVALLAVGTFRDAGWLYVFCVLGALACGSLAVAGGHSVRAVVVGALALPLAFFRSIPWLAKGARAWQQTREKSGTAGRIVLSLVVTFVLLVVFGALFASADAAFATMLGDILPEINARAIFRGVLYTVIGGLITAGAIFTVLAPPDLSGLERPATRRIGRIEVALPLGGLVLLFGAFVVVQLRFIFGDKAYIQKTSGLTFSEYAVQGFGQLLVVTMLTLVVIGLVSRWASKETSQDRVLLRALLGALVLLSMVIVGSAVWRMWLYQNTYGWTRERLFFGSVELYLGGVFILIAIAGWKLRASWFPRAAVAGFAGLLLFLGAANPEHFIAEQNVERFQKIDFWYLRALGPDAAPALAQLPEPYRSCALSWMIRDLKANPDQWYSWNLSRAHARELLKDIQTMPAGRACTESDNLNARR
ncbi:DUF4153 domain-containing protein [Catellatospora citrea]|uniref:DUF4173 domain-containing protein n=1 Tax=Catellatospora citrea TaxID=53366 RepID=A0A8J3KP98_9ACTN|nr:DUF4173 domain-containing protein [Catellatospora citrea]RKE08748.1 uncharacterized protein DUF4173 [Catellatospora citrea]GIG02294.1 hypothetical protein Cci01nite_73870 [Catellatospora citrea]